MKAIETVYKGYKFRSRLEARWAVFFDTLGVKYEYEKEGFDLEGMWYLPDFWLSQQRCWVEIKPAGDVDDEADSKALLLAMEAGPAPVWLVAGNPWPSEYQCYYYQFSDGGASLGSYTEAYMWVYDSYKGRYDIDWRSGSNHNTPQLIAAYTAARQARF